MKVHPEMSMKTKEGENQVSGFRCQVPEEKALRTVTLEAFGATSN
jgi:hypothetical protein